MLSTYTRKITSLPRFVRNDTYFPLEFDNVEEAFKDYKATISETIEVNLNLLEEISLPKHLNKDAVKEFLRKDIGSHLEEDELFEKAIEIGRYAKNMNKSMDSYFREIFAYHVRKKEEMESAIFNVSKMFLNSDLPLSFLRAIGDSRLAEKDYTDIFDKEIRKEWRGLLANLSNRPKFEKICETHNLWIKDFDERHKRMERQRVKLFWYVDFNNSSSVDEIFKEKFVKKDHLDEEVLRHLISELEEVVSEAEELNLSKLEFHPFVQSHETENDVRALVEMMQILDR
jgi:hypothetical protein